jgi:hypothetical protein
MLSRLQRLASIGPGRSLSRSTGALIHPVASTPNGQFMSARIGLLGRRFRLHDLRRTARTLMTHCRVDHDVAELAIGHTREGSTTSPNCGTCDAMPSPRSRATSPL